MPVFAVKGESLTDYWDYTHRIFECPTAASQHDPRRRRRRRTAAASRLQAESNPAVLNHPGNEEEEVLFAAIKKRIKDQPGWYTKLAKEVRGVTEKPPPACTGSI